LFNSSFALLLLVGGRIHLGIKLQFLLGVGGEKFSQLLDDHLMRFLNVASVLAFLALLGLDVAVHGVVEALGDDVQGADLDLVVVHLLGDHFES